jgi:hypothetical protein
VGARDDGQAAQRGSPGAAVRGREGEEGPRGLTPGEVPVLGPGRGGVRAAARVGRRPACWPPEYYRDVIALFTICVYARRIGFSFPMLLQRSTVVPKCYEKPERRFCVNTGAAADK